MAVNYREFPCVSSTNLHGLLSHPSPPVRLTLGNRAVLSLLRRENEESTEEVRA